MKIKVECGDWQPAPKALAKERVAFAIGDMHAHARHLEALQDFIRARIVSAYEPWQASVVWLGDYVDRGPQPLECLDLAAAGLGVSGVEEIRLKGNHESFLLDNIKGDDGPSGDLMVWISNGGRETIMAMLPDNLGADVPDLAEALRTALGPKRMEFLEGLELRHRVGDYLFVHAGINPSRPLDDQSENDLLWIREPFLGGTDWPYDVVVVHGHTPGMPEALPHRIGVDSGVFYSGKLTAVEIAGERLRFITASDRGRRGRFWDLRGSLFK